MGRPIIDAFKTVTNNEGGIESATPIVIESPAAMPIEVRPTI
jgi:hypothetical protein